jgi:ribulose-phosphate 3-epimerase
MSHPRIEIAPSILASDFLHLQDAVRQAEQGGADRLHIDVMDGRFVPNITVGPAIVEAIRGATTLFLEAHLMTVEPERQVTAFADAGADLITVHAEVSPHLYRTIELIHDRGKVAGVAINPGTHWLAVEEVLHIADLVLVMTVSPGFGGQEFLSPMLKKIRALRRTIDQRNLDTALEVDGGINLETVVPVVQAGARMLVAGTSVYHAADGVTKAIAGLRSAANGAQH